MQKITFSKKLSIQLNIKWINQQKIDKIQDLLNMHKGKHVLNFRVYDDEESIVLELKSRLQKVKISQELLSELDAEQIFYKLN